VRFLCLLLKKGEFSFDLNPQRRGTHIELPSRTSFRLRQGTNTKIQKYDVVQGSVLGDRSLDMKGVQFYYWVRYVMDLVAITVCLSLMCFSY